MDDPFNPKRSTSSPRLFRPKTAPVTQPSSPNASFASSNTSTTSSSASASAHFRPSRAVPSMYHFYPSLPLHYKDDRRLPHNVGRKPIFNPFASQNADEFDSWVGDIRSRIHEALAPPGKRIVGTPGKNLASFQEKLRKIAEEEEEILGGLSSPMKMGATEDDTVVVDDSFAFTRHTRQPANDGAGWSWQEKQSVSSANGDYTMASALEHANISDFSMAALPHQNGSAVALQSSSKNGDDSIQILSDEEGAYVSDEPLRPEDLETFTESGAGWDASQGSVLLEEEEERLERRRSDVPAAATAEVIDLDDSDEDERREKEAEEEEIEGEEEEDENEEYDVDDDAALYGDQEEFNEQTTEASHHHPTASFASGVFDFATPTPPRRQMDVVDYGRGAEWDDTEEGMVEEDGVFDLDEEEYEDRSYIEEDADKDQVATVLSDDDTADNEYNVIPHEIAPVVLDLMSSDDEAHQEGVGEFQQGTIEGTYKEVQEGLESRNLDGNMQQLSEDHRGSIDNLLNWNFDESQQDSIGIAYEHFGSVLVDEQEAHHQTDGKLPEEEVVGLVEEKVTGPAKEEVDFAKEEVVDFAKEEVVDFAKEEVVDFAKEEVVDFAKEEVVDFAESTALTTSLVKEQSSQLSLAELPPPDPPTITTAITMTISPTPTRVSIPALFSPNRPVPTFPGLSSASVQFDWGTPPRGFGGLLGAGEVATATATTTAITTTADDDEPSDSRHRETTPTPQPPFHEDLRDTDAAMLTPPPQRTRHIGRSPLSFEAVAFVGRGEDDVEVEAEVARRASNTEDERSIELGVDLSDMDERVEEVQGAESSEESQAELERVVFVLDDDSEDFDVNKEQAPVDLVQVEGGELSLQEPETGGSNDVIQSALLKNSVQDIRSEPATAMVHSITTLQREVVPAANQSSSFGNDSLILPTTGSKSPTQELNPPTSLGPRHDSKLAEWSPQSQSGVVAARVRAYEVAGATASAAAVAEAQVERYRGHRYAVEQEAIMEEEREAEAREQTDIIAVVVAEQQQRSRRSARTAGGNSVGAEVPEDAATISNSGDDEEESQQRSLRSKGPATLRAPRRGARRGVGEKIMARNRIERAARGQERKVSPVAKGATKEAVAGSESDDENEEKGIEQRREYSLRMRETKKKEKVESGNVEKRRRRRKSGEKGGEQMKGVNEKDAEDEEASDVSSAGSYDLRERSKSIGAMETAEPAQVSIHPEENHHVKNHALEEPSSSRRQTRSKSAGADLKIIAETAQEASLVDQEGDSDTSQGSYYLRDRHIKKHDLEARHSPRKRMPLASSGGANVATGAETKQDDVLRSQKEDSDTSQGSYDLRDRHIKKHELETTHSSSRRREQLISSADVTSAAIVPETEMEMIIENENNQDSENIEEEKAGAGRWLRRRRNVAAKGENTGPSEDGVVELPGYGLRSRRPSSQPVQTEQAKGGEPRRKGRVVLRLRRHDDQQVGGDSVLDEREGYGLRVRRVPGKIGTGDKADRPEQIQESEQGETEADDSVSPTVTPVVEDEAEMLSGKRKRRRSKRVVDRDGKYKVQEDTESTGDEEKASRKRNGMVGRSKRGEDQLALSAADGVTGDETETNEVIANGADNEVHLLEEQQDENAAPANKKQTRKRSRRSLTKTDGVFALGIEGEDSVSDEGMMERARRGKRASHGKGKAPATPVARDRGHGRGRTRGKGSLMTPENGRSRRSAKTLDSTPVNANLPEPDARTPIHDPDHENLGFLNALNDDELAALFRNHDCSNDAQHEALYNQLNESIQIRSESGTPVRQSTPVPVRQGTPVPVRQSTPVHDLENRADDNDAPENTELIEHFNADTKADANLNVDADTTEGLEITPEISNTSNAQMTPMGELHDNGDTTIQEPEQQTPRPRQPRLPIRSDYALRSKCPLRQFILSRASTKEYYISKSCLIEGPSPWLPRKRKGSEAFPQNGEDASTPHTLMAESSETAEQEQGEGDITLSRMRPDFLRSAKKVKSESKDEKVEVEVEVEIVKDRGEGKGKAATTDN